MEQRIFKDTIHGYIAQCGGRRIAWGLIRNKCVVEGSEVPTLDKIVEVKTEKKQKNGNKRFK